MSHKSHISRLMYGVYVSVCVINKKAAAKLDLNEKKTSNRKSAAEKWYSFNGTLYSNNECNEQKYNFFHVSFFVSARVCVHEMNMSEMRAIEGDTFQT